MKCDEARALCTPALDNELTVEQAALFNSHIEQCTSCCSAWDSALHIRSGLKDVLKSFPPTTDLESKIKLNLDLAERERSRVWKTQCLLAVACILPMVLVVAFLMTPKLQEPNFVAEAPVSSSVVSALTIDELIKKTSHSSNPENNDETFSSRSIDMAQKAEIGFPLVDAKLVAYDLGGAEILQAQDREIVRMCFKTDGSDICIDCYQAPSGVIRFNPRREFGDKRPATAQIGNVNLVMFSKHGIDVVYASELPEDQLLKLVRPNV
jgi:hypothetical protein